MFYQRIFPPGGQLLFSRVHWEEGCSISGFFHQGGGVSAKQIHLTKCLSREACGAAPPSQLPEEKRMGGSVGTGKKSSLSEELMRSLSSAWRGSEAKEEREFRRGASGITSP